ncbi:hypothetical protein DBV05_g11201 [Lasiodiplodia theobromae]|uniref:Rhodopsin domain-containing protein n=1 Tax=Lasiodiplodia theobromae TaxID=45133 RepID=A0A5N5CXV5_9PEZI|nr:hypothetical protein DBV05_g11201 [Lasiodiplodia theobromae]
MEISDIFGPPPAGLDLSEDQSGTVIAPIAVVLVLAITAVCLRFTTRHVVEAQRMAADDVWIAFALVVYAAAQIYAVTVTCTKTSIVCYYRRIFDFSIIFYVLMFLIIGYCITIITVMNTGCHPVTYMWDQYVDPTAEGKCVDLLTFYYANAIAATLIDIFILITPIYPVCKLQMPTTKKIAVLGIFLLGGVVIGASIARIVSLLKMATMKDQSWGLCSGLIWTCLEPCVGIVSACLPTLGPLVRHCRGKMSHASHSYPQESGEANHTTSSSRHKHHTYSSSKKVKTGTGPAIVDEQLVTLESDEYELRGCEVMTAHRTNSVRTSEEVELGGGAVTQELGLNRK